MRSALLAPFVTTWHHALLPALAKTACLLLLSLGMASNIAVADPTKKIIAIVGATVIDGNGGKPLKNTTVVIENDRISSIGAKQSIAIPDDAQEIDARGLYLLPGFIDSNVHASIYGNARRRETVVKYHERSEDLVLEFVQRQLKHGVTTIRDSYGALQPLSRVRDRIANGEVVGPRMLVAGNIIGWGGPFSLTFSLMNESDLTLFQQQWNDFIAQGAGEELMDMEPEELRAAVNRYLDKGPDFVKYGGTSHFSFPSLIGFSPRTQRVIVEETHKRGLISETHATSLEGLRMAVEAGVDLIQHPELMNRELSADLLKLIVDSGTLCAVRSNVFTGKPWQEHLTAKALVLASFKGTPEPTTSTQRRRRQDSLGEYNDLQRSNTQRLIGAGCKITIATDNYQGSAPEFRSSIKPEYQEAGIGSILAIEGLVELGMTEMEALVAATKNGALAAKGLADFGTIEEGKIADLLLLKGNPLKDISNIRNLQMVMAKGQVINTTALPEQAIFSAKATAVGR